MYGGYASRLEQIAIQELIEKYDLVVVEGIKDVVGLDELGICAIGLCSNQGTEQQIKMLVKFARQNAGNYI